MKILFSSLALMAGLFLAGCMTASKLNDVRVGMTKDQVIGLLGTPDSTSAEANVEYLTYYLVADVSYGRDQPYMVRLVDGKVESFGRYSQLMDLYYRPISASAPQVPIVVPSGSSGQPSPAPDIATQLERLKELKDQGVLSQDEFDKAKAKLLSSGNP